MISAAICYEHAQKQKEKGGTLGRRPDVAETRGRQREVRT